jgi:hypothetical protein
VTEQELAELDMAVAHAIGISDAFISYNQHGEKPMCVTYTIRPPDGGPYQPTRNPAEAMRLLEKHKLQVGPDGAGWYACRCFQEEGSYGPTPAIAICKAVVALQGKV